MKKLLLYVAFLLLAGCGGSDIGTTNTNDLGVSGPVATKIFSGRTEYLFDNSTPKTFRTIFSLAQHADAVRVIFAHSSEIPINIQRFSVAPLNSTENFALRDVTWTFGTFSGAPSKEISARPSVNRRAFLISDWIKVQTIDRTDNRNGLPLLAVAAYIDTPNTITLLGNKTGTDNFSNWAGHLTRPHVMRFNDGDCVTTPGNFTDETNRSTSPIVGIQYVARGKVITVFAAGDSITEGRGTYLGGSWALQACDIFSKTQNIPCEYGNIAWSGAESSLIRYLTTDVFSAGLIPHVLILPAGTPNDFITTITDEKIEEMHKNLMRTVDIAKTKNVLPILWTWIPSNTNFKPFGETDSKRRAYNNKIRTLATSGFVVADFDALIAGSEDGTGQMQMKDGTTNDGGHLNDLGEGMLAPVAENRIIAAMQGKHF